MSFSADAERVSPARALSSSSISRRRAWLGAFLLMVAYALSWADRNLPAILIEPMRSSLGVSDTQLALLTGFAFAVCHATLAVPAGWIADKWDRGKLIMAGILVWSLMTAACGFAPNFSILLICRMGVGVGEAVLLPAAYSLLADMFPREERPKALMIFVLGSPIGSALAFAGGGALHGYFAQSPVATGGLEPWRATFVVVGLLGVLVAASMPLLPEPRRNGKGVSAPPPTPAASADTTQFVRYLRAASFFLLPFVIGVTLFNVFMNGFVSWLAPLFVRTYQWTLSEAGGAVGSAILVTGLIGAPIGAALSRLIGRRREQDASVIVLILSAAGLLAFASISPLASTGETALAGIVVALAFAMIATVVAPAAILNCAPSNMRARVSAIYLLIANLIGSGAGPAIYAMSTDFVFRDPGRLYLSMSWVSAALLGTTLAFLLLSQRRYGRAIRLADQYSASTCALEAARDRS